MFFAVLLSTVHRNPLHFFFRQTHELAPICSALHATLGNKFNFQVDQNAKWFWSALIVKIYFLHPVHLCFGRYT